MTNLELLSSQEACARLGIPRRTFMDQVTRGQIATAGKLPGRTGAFLFDPAEVERVRREREQALRGSR
ncbi:helix-turn-helix domain-containing protein [Cutibacterium avidum]|uniref:helix-turn-helix domain-containing protein n=1 Tax=Cutibacterium avidum TaxID=33010 RepID=UPI00192BC15F|nr:helix-turn-helix domain-containing protein [Cutibacterium avidum]